MSSNANQTKPYAVDQKDSEVLEAARILMNFKNNAKFPKRDIEPGAHRTSGSIGADALQQSQASPKNESTLEYPAISKHLPPMPRIEPEADRLGETNETSENSESINSKQTLSIFNALLDQEDVLLVLTTQYMEPREMFHLYCISKQFYAIVNRNITTYILCSARRWARLTASRPKMDVEERIHHSKIPGVSGNPSVDSFKRRSKRTASRSILHACGTEPTPPGIYSPHDITTLLPFHNYLDLCMYDPKYKTTPSSTHPSNHRDLRPQNRSSTILTSNPEVGADTNDATSSNPMGTKDTRHVPSFRYLSFLMARARQAHSLIHHLAQHGHRVPEETTPAVVVKLSLSMDIPTNARRFALFRNQKYWTNDDLYVLNLFLMKVHMCFTDPVDGSGETALPRTLLAQRGLGPLEAALARREYLSLLDVVRLWVRTGYVPPPEHVGYSILGVPADQVGKTCQEFWGQPKEAQRSENVAKARLRQASSATTSYDEEQVTGDAGQVADEGDHVSGEGGNTLPSATSTSHAQHHEHPATAGTVPRRQGQRAQPPRYLASPDELLIGESIRRQFPLHHFHPHMIAYGYVDSTTFENLPDPADPAEESRRGTYNLAYGSLESCFDHKEATAGTK